MNQEISISVLTDLLVKTSSSTLVVTHLQFPGKNIIASQDAANSYAKFFAD